MKRALPVAFVTAISLAVVSPIALAGRQGGSFERSGWVVRQPTRWIVSGVLQANTAHNVIKPIHTILVEPTEDAALAAFAKLARHDYPDFTLIGSLATRVPDAGRCENSI
ncbi:hypothetical protein [Paraburkholderia youngii]|uniref:hypothetical protein n=1 Tax=Paraburkholderia youngii TaxID=2782701 RepID=UPI003D1C52E8